MELIIKIINPRDLKIRKKEKKKGQKRECGGKSMCHTCHLSLVMITIIIKIMIMIMTMIIMIMIILYLILMTPASAHFWIRSRYFMRELLFWSQDTWRPEPRPN